MHIIIVGCGIGGLATAIGLVNKYKQQSMVHRRSTSKVPPPPPITITLVDSLTYNGLLGTSSSGYDFSPSGMAAIVSLGGGNEAVLRALSRYSYMSHRLLVEDAQRQNKSTTVLSIDLADIKAYPRGTLTLTRSDFIRVLFNCLAHDYGFSSFPKTQSRVTLDAPGLPTVRVLLGDGLRRIRRWGNDPSHRTRVSIELESGRVVSGSVLVGADGVHSSVAKLVAPSLGTRLRQRQVALWIRTEEAAHAPLASGAPAIGTFAMATCDGAFIFYGRMVQAAAPDRRSNFIVVCFTHAGGIQSIGRGERLDILRRIIRERHPRGASHLLASLMKARIEDVCGTNLYEPIPGKLMKTASRGPVVVIGDALHPFTPFLGQGASQALVDADALSTILLAPGYAPDAALASFSRARVGPTNRLIKESASLGSLIDRPRVAHYAHSVMHMLPASFVASRFFSGDADCFPDAVRAAMFRK
mmetsp:Transcript_14617/g.45885  ORF Transcript_14617/g.45885 Transcript_14617/m.45885 type:complete len:471 (-) Transcript_14617:432-1844(-)